MFRIKRAIVVSLILVFTLGGLVEFRGERPLVAIEFSQNVTLAIESKNVSSGEEEETLDIRPIATETVMQANFNVTQMGMDTEVIVLDPDGVVREEVVFTGGLPPRILTVDKITKKYGLTNVLMFCASMMAYAAFDDRAMVFPDESPVDVEKLLNMKETEKAFRPLNAKFIPRGYPPLKKVNKTRARKLGLTLGNRLRTNALDQHSAMHALEHLNKWMRRTRNIPLLSQRDMFLAFPFFATRPLDLCFFLKRFSFNPTIKRKAELLMNTIAQVGNVSRLLTLHLRLEADAKLINKGFDKVSAKSLSAFLRTQIEPKIREYRISGVYVCAGKLKSEFMSSLRELSVPVFFKTDFPSLDISLAENGTVTSHFSAAVDLEVKKKAVVAVSAWGSTFAVAVMARRCPSPQKGTTLSLEALRNTTLFRWANNSRSIMKGPTDELSDEKRVRGVFVYRVHNSGDISSLEHFGCDRPLMGHCYA